MESPEAAVLVRLMAQYDGNRELIAKRLGISKTTLWRRLKKLGIEEDTKSLEPENVP